MERVIEGTIIGINGPIIRARGLAGISMLDIAEVGPDKLIGEVIKLDGDIAFVQVYEDDTGLKPGDTITSSGRPLSVLLAPGLISNIYDGIQRPLVDIAKILGSYIKKGVKVSPLDTGRKWDFTPTAKEGDEVREGAELGEIRETESVIHRVMVPPGVSGKLSFLAGAGSYDITEEIYRVKGGNEHGGKLATY
ncbi:MAG: V-type ATP synthase subunit A, partial [Chrysiogenales bacterium]